MMKRLPGAINRRTAAAAATTIGTEKPTTLSRFRKSVPRFSDQNLRQNKES
jgi:hypothetical protein